MSVMIKKQEILSKALQSLPNDELLILFTQEFYKNVSFGYMSYIAKDDSKILNIIAQQAYDLFKNSPLEGSVKNVLKIYKEYGYKVLYLHAFDQRFIVRSINIWTKKQGIKTEEIIHPLFTPSRKKNGELIDINDDSAKSESIICIILPIQMELKEDYADTISNIYKKLSVVAQDYNSMQKTVNKIANSFTSSSIEYVKQAGKFLRWLEKGHFINLGIRIYEQEAICSLSGGMYQNKLSISEQYGLLKEKDNSYNLSLPIANINLELNDQHVINISKKSQRSDIYRESRIDLIEIYELCEKNNTNRVIQIIGLFESEFYKSSPFDVPYLNEKAERIFDKFGFTDRFKDNLTKSYDSRVLKDIIESIPLDEFYYLKTEQLIDLTTRVINMYDRLTVFIRNDDFGQSTSVLIYLPKNRYSEDLKLRFGKLILNELGGELTSANGFVGNTSFARLVYIINGTTNIAGHTEQSLEDKLWTESQTWEEKFTTLCKTKKIFTQIQFSKSYYQEISPHDAADDAYIIQNHILNNHSIYFDIVNKENKLIIRGFRNNESLTLGEIIPIFSNFQIIIKNEQNFYAKVNGEKIWIHHYEISNIDYQELTNDIKEKLINGLYAAWQKIIEVDPFNSLIINCNLDFKEIIIFRALGRFLKQLGLNYSQKSLSDCLATYPKITQLLIKYFCEKFSIKELNNNTKIKNNDFTTKQIIVSNLLSEVTRLDHDRILRRYLNLIDSMTRTNAYKNGQLHPYPMVSFKFNSNDIIDINSPAPFAEIFIYSPTMEGSHLRGGHISRGGIRWSDRTEDFRSEVLGLMKAQMVKNAIIVPSGAKGCFVVKNYMQLKENGLSNSDLKEIVITEYSNFIKSLLEITDNITENKIINPKNITITDGGDPYLVVAADKGTATFSDIANRISHDFGFWLDDAFASGGSRGYDHKKLAITAKGAWIAVRRHFWEIGINCQNESISVVGIGDMSGDVFGNGMLQSEKIKLVAAFNHNHIFLDPDPNIEASFKERKRLFNESHSSWDDYDRTILSNGGGIYDRVCKSILITPEVARLLEISQENLSPDELITKILTAQADLIWFGGIGTFIKSSHETNTEVADRINDSIRVNAKDVKAKVIGEGANLGVTQLGRVEYALNNGRINTDAVDNSAGVSCSDHEVNLKILCQQLIEDQIINSEERDKLLSGLAEEICNLVLEDNWTQTLLLSKLEINSKEELDSFILLIKNLEDRNIMSLRRNVEFIPSDEGLSRRKLNNQGLTRPELAVLVAYTKIHLYHDLVEAFSNTACFGETYYKKYFPVSFANKYSDRLSLHPLKTEITATVLSNLVVNIMGPCFVLQMTEAFQSNTTDVVRTFVEVLEVGELDVTYISDTSLKHCLQSTITLSKKMQDNISQCVMVKLKFPYLHLNREHFINFNEQEIPFPIRFANRALLKKNKVTERVFTKNYENLNLTSLWEWALTKKPSTSWEISTWLNMLSDLIMLIVELCNKTWNEDHLTLYIEMFKKFQNHIASITDTKQDLLLLDHIIRQISKGFSTIN